MIEDLKMSMGLVGRKCGMTRVFTAEGVSIPVTVIEVNPNRVCQIKKGQVDGYSALQVTMGVKRSSKINKPNKGHFAKLVLRQVKAYGNLLFLLVNVRKQFLGKNLK